MNNSTKPLVAVGDCGEVIEALASIGCECLILERSEILAPPVASHADMLCCKTGEYCGYSYCELFNNKVGEYGFDYRQPSVPLGREYPKDIGLNCLHIAGCLVGKTDFCASEIIESARRDGLEIVNVRQGYTRCSTLKLGEYAAITADSGIAGVLMERGVDVLRIAAGGIDIDGYDYGFIGGASAVVGNKVIFCGEPLTHPCGEAIVGFIRKHGMDIITTDTHRLYDFGSAVVLKG